eukprot:5827430-Ditylum_brightwellii.AAC.1
MAQKLNNQQGSEMERYDQAQRVLFKQRKLHQNQCAAMTQNPTISRDQTRTMKTQQSAMIRVQINDEDSRISRDLKWGDRTKLDVCC